MIYLDNAATARLNQNAFSRAEAIARECYFNPSALYRGGTEAAAHLRAARESLIRAIADPAEFTLVFTSGGTEADNHAVFSCAKRGNAVTTAGEHAAVYSAFTELKNRGVEPRFALLDRHGGVRAEELLSLVDEKTSFVSVVHVNNETGAVNDVSALARAVKQKNPRCVFHSDGVQAFGKLPFRLTKDVDLYSVSAHKIGGLKGTGALFKRKGLAMQPLLYGGGQEGNLRSGTENVLGALAFAFAAEEKFSSLQADLSRLERLREGLFSALDGEIFVRITPEKNASPYILTVAARGLRGEILQRLLEERGVIAGTGSACSSKKPFSRVIEACGYDKELLGGVLRLSFSPETTEEELSLAAMALNSAAKELAMRIK